VITGEDFRAEEAEEMVSVRLALAVPLLSGPRVAIAAPELGVSEGTLLELVAVTVTVAVPAEVGVPEMRPVALLIDKPSGKPVAL